MTAAIIVLVLLQVADLVTSYVGLVRRGKREANPAMRWLLDRFGFAAIVFVKVAGTVALVALALHLPSTMGLFGLGLLVAGQVYVLWNNLKVLDVI